MPLYKDRNKNPSIKNYFVSLFACMESWETIVVETIANFHDHTMDLKIIQ